jgi:Flp pilus assembly protein TadB
MTVALLLSMAWLVALIAAGWRGRPTRRPSLDADPPTDARPREAEAPVSTRARRRGRPRHVLVALAVLGPAVIILSPLPALGLTVGAVLAREHRRRAQSQRSTAARLACLPSAIDHLVVAVAAGLTPRQGLHVVAERGPPLLRPAFTEVWARLEGGEALTDALPRLLTAIGEPARGLVRAVTVAERDGAPLRSLLGPLAEDARRQRRQEAEATIRRLPVRLSFPLVGCILPAFVLLTVVPLLVAGFSRLGQIGP